MPRTAGGKEIPRGRQFTTRHIHVACKLPLSSLMCIVTDGVVVVIMDIEMGL